MFRGTRIGGIGVYICVSRAPIYTLRRVDHTQKSPSEGAQFVVVVCARLVNQNKVTS